jgi:tetratricopeptide (TPR) repeat protein
MKESLELTDLGDAVRNETELIRQYDVHHRSRLVLETTEGRLELIAIQNNLAVCHYEQGRFHSAETLLRHCIDQYHRSILRFIPPSPLSLCGGHVKKEYLYLLFNLANVLSRLQRFEEAEALYLFCLQQIERSFDPTPSSIHPSPDPSPSEENQRPNEASHDPDYLSILSNLALLYASNHLPDPYAYHALAEKLFQECLTRRKEVLELIFSDRATYQQKLASGYYRLPHCPRPALRSRGRVRREEEDILRRDEFYSLDAAFSLEEEGSEGEEGGLEQYDLLQRHYSILWLHSLFNLCCHLIETGHYDDPSSLSRSLGECLEKSQELDWDERDEFVDRVLILMKRLEQQQRGQEQQQSSFRTLWANIYSSHSEDHPVPPSPLAPCTSFPHAGLTFNGSFLSWWCDKIFSQRASSRAWGRGREDWGDVVMDPDEWFENSFQPKASSASPRYLPAHAMAGASGPENLKAWSEGAR